MVDSYLNFLGAPSHKLLIYLLGFGCHAQFGHPFAGDRPNYESSESRGTRAVATKSDRQTMTLDQR
jgi:hypothetical protein